MTANIDILGFLGLMVTIVLSIVSSVAWVTSKLDKIKDAIASLDKSAVTHEQCSQKRKGCPCVKDIDEIKEKLYG